jgi:hypothetical protein
VLADLKGLRLDFGIELDFDSPCQAFFFVDGDTVSDDGKFLLLDVTSTLVRSLVMNRFSPAARVIQQGFGCNFEIFTK